MKDVAVALLVREGRVFLQCRHAGASMFPGFWELPGGKVEAGETPLHAVHREVREELGCGLEVFCVLPLLDHVYETFHVRLHAFLGRPVGNPETPLAHGWFGPERWGGLSMPEATRRLLATVETIPEDP